MNFILDIGTYRFPFYTGRPFFTGCRIDPECIVFRLVISHISDNIMFTDTLRILELDSTVLFFMPTIRLRSISAGIGNPLFQQVFISRKRRQILFNPLFNLRTCCSAGI